MVDSAPLLHGHSWTNQRVRGWWMSEKYDGVRGYWDGEKLLSRDMKPLRAPSAWLAWLPEGIALDGEIWCGRGRFGAVLGAVKSERHAAWEEMRFMVFDIPGLPVAYEERQAVLAELPQSQVVRVVDFCMCEGLRHMKAALREVYRKGGEGLMLRQPGSLYTVGRSHSVLKVRWQNNTELLGKL
jgi:DNA ligase-1